MGVPEADCGGGEAGDLKTVPNIGCGEEMWVSHGSNRRWLLGGRLGSHGSPWTMIVGQARWEVSRQSQTLVVGEDRRGFSWQSQMLVVGAGKA